jgi:uncharacterized iron-regulated membrane protein
MNPKTIASAVLLLFVGASVVYLVVTEVRQRATTAPASQSAVPEEGAATGAGGGREAEAPRRATTAPVSQSAVPQEGAATEAGGGRETEAPQRAATAPVSQSAVPQEGAATEAGGDQETPLRSLSPPFLRKVRRRKRAATKSRTRAKLHPQ